MASFEVNDRIERHSTMLAVQCPTLAGPVTNESAEACLTKSCATSS